MMTHPPHILIVDDHREIRDALVKYLEKNGMRATSVGSASAMDAALKVGQFDLIVLASHPAGSAGPWSGLEHTALRIGILGRCPVLPVK